MQIYTDYQYVQNIFWRVGQFLLGELAIFYLESWTYIILPFGHILFCHLAEKEQRTTDYSKR